RGMALGLAALLFVSGMAAGVAADRWVAGDRGHGGESRLSRHRPDVQARRYAERLGLDEAQERKVEEILRRTWTATRKAIEPIDPEVDAIRRRGDGDIRSLLHGDQLRRFDEMVAEQEQRRAAIRKGLDLKRGGGSR
ncbi:MAG TPA: hypothetical protein VKB80_19085, partial [Kofleriaceae bacterium]|nr:hypothetical protein [Kofleriaceae bacterium]